MTLTPKQAIVTRLLSGALSNPGTAGMILGDLRLSRECWSLKGYQEGLSLRRDNLLDGAATIADAILKIG